jgi:hypothetical protein
MENEYITKEVKEYLDSKIGKRISLFELEQLNADMTCAVSSPEYAKNNKCIGGILEAYGSDIGEYRYHMDITNDSKYDILYIERFQ